LAGPHPPAGATLCKQGLLSAKDIRDACKAPPAFGGVPTDGCDQVTSDGGRYELWCTSSAQYLWARIDALRPNQPPFTCPVTPDVELAVDAVYSYTTSLVGAGSTTVSTGSPDPLRPAAGPLSTHPSLVVEATLPGASTSGSANIWMRGLDTTCVRGNGNPDSVMVAGVSVTWP
jgi:hypothetical protein